EIDRATLGLLRPAILLHQPVPPAGNVVSRAFVACSTAAVIWLAGPVVVSGQQGVAAARGEGVQADSIQLKAIRIVDAVRLDGHLSEPFWALADSITELRQREPDEGAPSTERTVVKLARDQSALYVGIRAYDSDGHGLR